MKIRKSVYLFICLWVASFIGCVALDIREANHDLINLYRAKVEAIKSDDAAQEVSINGALDVLAKQANEKSHDLSLSVANRISFSRIAATAAWQAGSNNVINYSKTGQSLCDQDNNFNSAPRDCGMLLIIPDLASADELKARYDKFNKHMETGSNPPTREEVENLYFDIASRIDSLLKEREIIKVKASAAHPKLLESLDKNTGRFYCRHLQEAFGLIVRIAGDESEAYRKADCKNYQLKIRLKKLDFSQKIAPCLPSGTPKVPEGCN